MNKDHKYQAWRICLYAVTIALWVMLIGAMLTEGMK